MAMAGLVKRLGERAFNGRGEAVAEAINGFAGGQAAAFQAIRERIDLVDMVLDIRDARIPLSSANANLQDIISRKRRLVLLNKMDLADRSVMPNWTRYFEQCNECCYLANAHNKDGMKKLLHYLQAQLNGVISKKPAVLVMAVGIPNIGKSALINSLHQIARTRFPALEKLKRATIGPLPCVTEDIKGFKIGHHPSIFVLDTPGVLARSIPDVETGLKLALTGALEDSIVGEDCLVKYLLSILNSCAAPLQWKNLDTEGSEEFSETLLEDSKDDTSNLSKAELKKRRKERRFFTDHTQDNIVFDVRRALFKTFTAFENDLEKEDGLENLINTQLAALQKALRIPDDSEKRKTARKLLNLYRIGRLGHYTLDTVPENLPST